MFHRMILSFVPLVALVAAMAGTPVVAAEGDAAALQEAEAHLEKILDETQYFYKVKTLTNGQKLFSVLYQNDAGSTQIDIIVSRMGTSFGSPIFGYSGFATVASAAEGESLPPGVIKLVASMNDGLSIGYYSTSKDFRRAYSNITGVVGGLTKPELSFSLFMAHANRLDLLKEVEPIMKEAGQ